MSAPVIAVVVAAFTAPIRVVAAAVSRFQRPSERHASRPFGLRAPLGRAVAVLAAVTVVLAGSPPASAGTPDWENLVFYRPPGLIIRGERVVLRADILVGSSGGPFTLLAHARGAPTGPFTQLRMTLEQGGLVATVRVPPSLLSGSVLDTYVVIRSAGASITIPPGAPEHPYRSWILTQPDTIRLGPYRFGQTRRPDAVVARATAVRLGLDCQNNEFPHSFAVGPDGTVWVNDTHDLLGWDPGRPGRPSHVIPLHFGALDVAVGADETLYVTGVIPGDPNPHLRLYAFTPDGRQLWMGRILTTIANARIRLGPGGILYSVDPSGYGWAPATDREGRPLSLTAQRERVSPHQPVAAAESLVVSDTGTAAVSDLRLGLASASGRPLSTWRVVVPVPSVSFTATATMVNGDLVTVLNVLGTIQGQSDDLVLRISPSGRILTRFSVHRSFFCDEPITDRLVGADGNLYVMRTSRTSGVRIERYSLASHAVSSPTPPSAAPSSSAPSSAPATGGTKAQGGSPPTSSGFPWGWGYAGLAAAALVLATAAAVRVRRHHHPRQALQR